LAQGRVSRRRRSAPDEVVVTPPASIRRRSQIRFVTLFVLLGLPVAAVLGAILGWLPALGYLIAQTAFLTFGLRRRQQPVLRLSSAGISYEPGRFQVRCTWEDVARVEEVVLPSGVTEGFALEGPRLHWAADAGARHEVRAKGWDRVIPVGSFEPDWRAGRIGGCVRRWAPALLEP
jgi:hypothetical protein